MRSLLPVRWLALTRSRLLVQRKKRPNRKRSLVSSELTATTPSDRWESRATLWCGFPLWTRTIFLLVVLSDLPPSSFPMPRKN